MYNLSDIVLEEISLVDRPANPEATVVLYKRHDKDSTMSDFEKMSDDMKAKLKPYMDKGMSEDEAMKAYNQDKMKKMEESLEMLKAAIIKEGYAITAEGIEKSDPVETVDLDGETIAKSDVPDVVWNELKKREDEIIELRKAQEAEDLRKRADNDLPNLKGTSDERGALLKAVDDIEDEEVRKSVLSNLKAADAACAGAFEEVGKAASEDDYSDPEQKLEKMAKAYSEEKGVGFYVAYDAVTKTDEGKALVKAIYKKD